MHLPINYVIQKEKSSSFLDNLLKSVLKRQMPYLLGGTITGTIMAYYYGFLFTVIVNSVIWFAISTLINKYYWKYTGFKEEFQLALRYIGRIKKKKSNNNLVIKYDKHTEGVNEKRYLSSHDKDNKETDNSESPLKTKIAVISHVRPIQIFYSSSSKSLGITRRRSTRCIPSGSF